MDNQTLIKNLSDLVQLDIDAVYAYDQALEKIDHTEIHKRIYAFRMDHINHITNLNVELKRLGGTPLEVKKDFTGYVIEGFTLLRSITGTEGALKAMRGNENITNKTYKEAMQWKAPQEIKSLIQKNYLDEQKHLQYIEQAIESKLWENGVT